jgi:hypothetical protein
MQELIVAVIVAFAAWVVLRKYLPRTWRRRLAGSSAGVARSAGLMRLALWLERDLPAAASCGSGCGTCGSCGTGAPASAAGTAGGAGGAGAGGAGGGAAASAGTGSRGLTAAPVSATISVDDLRKTIRRR